MSAVATRARKKHAERDHHQRRRRRSARSRSARPRCRGQVEGDGLAGDEVVRGEHRELRCRHRDQHRLARVDLDAYVLAHHAEWERLEALTRKRRLDGRESDELVERYQRVATHLSVIRTAAPDATRDHLPVAAAQPRPQPRRSARARHLARRPHVRHSSASRPRSTGCAGGGSARPPANVVATVRDDVVAARPPERRAEPALARATSTSWSTTTSPATTASTPPPTSPPRSGPTTCGSPPSAWPSASLGLPVVYLLFQNIANLAIIGSIMTRHGHGAEFWGLILPHGLLELTAVFVAGGVGLRLFWSWVEPGDLTRAQSFAREGRTAGDRRPRARRRPGRERLHRGVRDPEPAADLGPDRDRDPGRGDVPRLRVRARPPAVRSAATPATSTRPPRRPRRRSLSSRLSARRRAASVRASASGAATTPRPTPTLRGARGP